MTESAPALNDPFAVLTGPLAATTRMQLEVVDSAPLSPGMQRLVLTAPELAGLQYQPGQDMMLMVAVGKIFLAEAVEWHLFVGDDSALPAFLAMTGALPAGARALVILEVPGPGSEQDLVTAADAQVTWLYRDGGPAGDPAALVATAAAVALPPGRGHAYLAGEATVVLRLRATAAAVALPPGRGHAYLAGEATVVLRLRETLAARGLAQEQISPKAYWGRGRANASHGEPARDG